MSKNYSFKTIYIPLYSTNQKMIPLKKISSLLLLLSICTTQITHAQKRFQSEIFTEIDSIKNIQYGEATNIKGEREKLLLDIISPTKADTLAKRPLLIFIHGGGFKNNSKNGAFSAMLCNSFAKRGYVTATIDYRLGVEGAGTDNDYQEAMYRAQQDGKAAVRFFRRYAEKYGIDTARIFITGSSAGSKTCLAMAYLKENNIPKGINTNKWGSLEGESGNEGYSSKVHAVMNNWGAIVDYKWIQKGDAPLFNTAGLLDKTVPYDSSYDYHSFKYGPYILYQQCLRQGVATGWRPFVGTGHTLDNNKLKQDSAVQSMAQWLFTQLNASKQKPEEGVTKWDADINRFDSLNLVEHHTDSAILFLGSSYIRFWDSIRKDIQYPDIIHRGFGGSNLRDVAYYVKRIVYPHQPKAIFMYVGNDIVVSEKDKSPDQVLELFKFIVQTIREKYPTIPITWLPISPSEKRWASWDKVQEANALIAQYCSTQKGLYYIPFHTHFLGTDGLPIKKLYREDKLHYNVEGYKVWGNAIKESVHRIVSSN